MPEELLECARSRVTHLFLVPYIVIDGFVLGWKGLQVREMSQTISNRLVKSHSGSFRFTVRGNPTRWVETGASERRERGMESRC